MSYQSIRHFELKNFDLSKYSVDIKTLDKMSETELFTIFSDILEKGVHGFCFSLYEDGQKPGHEISKEQVARRMNILKPHMQWVRSFSCVEGNEYVPIVAKEQGLSTLVGAWLGSDLDKNEEEINALIDLAKKGYVNIAAVGNEVLYRNDLSLEQLLGYIQRVKEALPDIPIGYVDAYYEFSTHPILVDNCDVILTNCYPFWEGTPFEYSIAHMNSMYHQTKEASRGKKVIITETGWPSQGQSIKSASPSPMNALKYFIYTQLWASENGIENFYFSSFDESWKTGPEGDVGAHWGVWNKNEELKFKPNLI